MANKKEDKQFKEELARQKQNKLDHEMAMKMEAEMNQGAGGAMMGGEEEDDIMVDTMEQLGHRSKVPNFGFYNDFDDVLADDNN